MASNRVFAREDGKLNQLTAVTSRTRAYKDIDLSFTAKPNGEIYKKVDAGAVKQAVKNIIMTNRFEKPFLEDYGADVRSLLFELADEDIEDQVIDRVTYAIEQYEPRARVLDVIVNNKPDYNSISITIEFQVVSTEEILTIQTTLSRLR